MKIIQETTEFGLDMLRGLPIAYWHVLNKEPHKCIVKPGLKALYHLITPHVEETDKFHPSNPSSLYSHSRPKWTVNNWTPPPLKTIFEERSHGIDYILPNFNKPTVVINNKFSACWDEIKTRKAAKELNVSTSMDEILTLPMDLESHATAARYGQKSSYNGIKEVSLFHYSLPMLRKIIDLLSDKYQIIYIRPIEASKGYFTDHNLTFNPGDYELLENEYPDVYTIKEFMDNNKHIDFTIAQFILESMSTKHLSTLGGNCKVSAYFGGDVIMYQNRIWKEGHPKGNRGIFNTGSWLQLLSNANIVSLTTYESILEYIKNKWITDEN